MLVHLHCPACRCQFSARPGPPEDKILDRRSEECPWYALGDGETFEDTIFAALTARGRICCPDCGAAVPVSEESLGRYTLEMLAQW